MSRNQKQSHGREVDEDEDGAPRVEEHEIDDDERAQASLGKSTKDAQEDEGVDEDDIVEDIDLDDLDPMEGPDA